MRMPDRAARRYLRQVRRGLPCSRKRKRAFLETVARDIEEYLRETPEADYQALVRRFGSPIQIAEDYLEETDTLELIRGLQRTQNGFGRVRSRTRPLFMAGLMLCEQVSQGARRFLNRYVFSTISAV